MTERHDSADAQRVSPYQIGPEHVSFAGMREHTGRLHRATMSRPCEARADGRLTFITDVSLHGLRVSHHGHPGPLGQLHRIEFEWEGRRASVVAELRWCNIQSSIGRASYAKSVYDAGYKIVEATPEAETLLRELMLDDAFAKLDDNQVIPRRNLRVRVQ